MTTSPSARWDTRVLETPVVLDLPARLPARPDPLTRTAVAAIVAQADGDRDAPALVARLGHAGVVALRTPIGTFEVRELLNGWLLVTSPDDPDPVALAIIAYLRARRLADDRLHQTPVGPAPADPIPAAPPEYTDPPPPCGPAGPDLPGLL